MWVVSTTRANKDCKPGPRAYFPGQRQLAAHAYLRVPRLPWKLRLGAQLALVRRVPRLETMLVLCSFRQKSVNGFAALSLRLSIATASAPREPRQRPNTGQRRGRATAVSHQHPPPRAYPRIVRPRPRFVAMFRPLFVLPFLAFLLSTTAHRIEIDPGGKECYFENLQPQDRVRAICAISPEHELQLQLQLAGHGTTS